MSRDQVLLQIRSEIFDHGIFPCPPRLSPSSLQNLVKSLYLVSSIDCKVTLHQWVEAAEKHLMLPAQEAEVYFEVFRTLIGEKRSPHSMVDLKQFSLYLALQLLNASGTRSSLGNASSLSSKFNSDHLGGSLGSSQPAMLLSSTVPAPSVSPRGKAVRGLQFSQYSSEYQIAQYFIKSNLKLLLRLVSSDIQNPEVSLTANEFNSLLLLFNPVNSPHESLSRLTAYFNSKNPSLKAGDDDLSNWIMSKLTPTNLDSSILPNVTFISDLSRAVTIKGGQEIVGKELRIMNCEESHIFINAPVKQVLFLSCREVTCFIAAISRVCTVDKCENCTLTIASHALRISNSVDCTIHSYTTLSPILYGDNRAITMAPMNAYFADMARHVERAGIPLGSQSPQSVHNWSMPIELNNDQSNHCFALLQPKDFFKMVLPKQIGDNSLASVLTPEEYINAISIREAHFIKVQEMISKAQLTNEQELQLHLAIQGYFREYLVSTGHIKTPIELVKMIDQE